ncbi:DUF2975 domain-containing protein [Kineococcus gynurae]|uniref:DUF2975 domain-containing protein n=1 Tax=Kineococcus gynurae TaxID=452979 RepID=A0ABV5LWB2_9ACTN
MAVTPWVIRPLQLLLVTLFVAFVGAQVLLILGSTMLVPAGSPELERFRWAVLLAAGLGLVCLQVVLVATWRLLGLVRSDRIFRPGALPWVDAIVVALVMAWVILLAAAMPVLQFAQADDAPGLGGLHLMLLLVAAVPVLMMLVMRTLLRRATALTTDLEGVV